MEEEVPPWASSLFPYSPLILKGFEKVQLIRNNIFAEHSS